LPLITEATPNTNYTNKKLELNLNSNDDVN
jgi:hypothetical protein